MIASLSPRSGRQHKASGASPRIRLQIQHPEPAKRATAVVALPPVSRAQIAFGGSILGLAPQALCCRPFHGLKSRLEDLFLGLAPQALCCRPLRRVATPIARIEKFCKVVRHEESTGWNRNYRDGVCPHHADPGLSRLHGREDR